ncbi:MAG: hypothetical protein GY711_10040 [bacterium]|nr:hypothetical protein [bacterium]
MRWTYACFLAAAGALWAPDAGAQDLVDLQLSGNCTIAGDTARIDLFAISNGASSPAVGAIDAILSWDPTALALAGEDNSSSPYSWLITGFLPDADGINDTFLDGDAIFTALATPGFPALAPPAPGLMVTTLSFEVLNPAGNLTVSFVPMQGMFGKTRVLDFFIPALEITGDISDTHTDVACPNLGSSYCGNVPNSTGVPALITGTGSAVVAQNDFTLSANALPPNRFGYFLASDLTGFIDLPAAGLSQGFFCLGTGPNLGRYNTQVQNSGPTGFFSLQLDLNAVPIAAAPGTIALSTGDTWYFQCWYRDVGNTNNFSDAICVDFL